MGDKENEKKTMCNQGKKKGGGGRGKCEKGDREERGEKRRRLSEMENQGMIKKSPDASVAL